VYGAIPADLCALIEPVVEDHGCELVDVDVQRGHPGMLRITIDSEFCDGQVAVGKLAAVSREIETQLDASDWMASSYQLEVTSPGLDRVLGRPKDFEAALASGSEVKLKTRRPQNGRRRFKGVLKAFENGTVRVECDGVEFAIEFDEIEKANTIYKFTSADFKGRASD